MHELDLPDGGVGGRHRRGRSPRALPGYGLTARGWVSWWPRSPPDPPAALAHAAQLARSAPRSPPRPGVAGFDRLAARAPRQRRWTPQPHMVRGPTTPPAGQRGSHERSEDVPRPRAAPLRRGVPRLLPHPQYLEPPRACGARMRRTRCFSSSSRLRVDADAPPWGGDRAGRGSASKPKARSTWVAFQRTSPSPIRSRAAQRRPRVTRGVALCACGVEATSSRRPSVAAGVRGWSALTTIAPRPPSSARTPPSRRVAWSAPTGGSGAGVAPRVMVSPSSC